VCFFEKKKSRVSFANFKQQQLFLKGISYSEFEVILAL